jgi:hypothetical protein
MNNGLIGKWELIEYYMSIGGPLERYKPKDVYRIEFTTDGRYLATGQEPATYAFSSQDSTVSITNLSTKQTGVYSVRVNSNQLSMSFHYCIEGCSAVYKAVK